ncbi:MAG: LptF/LptG family permease [Deinococcota bacterium]|nr:LptF/LptG family permease [Deinococcota bacterium]
MTRFGLYLVREIAPLYLAGLIALIVLLLGEALLGVLADFISRGASPALVAQFLIFSLPAAVSRGLPLALLFAALLGLTRLAQDSEIKAALVLGLSPKAFAAPLLGLGLAVTLLSFLSNEVLVPWSSGRALEVQKDILIQSPQTLIEAGSFFTDALGRNVYIERLEPGGVVRNITVIQSAGAAGPSEVIQSEAGVLDEVGGVWRFESGRFITYRNSETVLDAVFSGATVPVRRLAAAALGAPDLTQVPLRELWGRVQRGQSSGIRMAAERTALHRKFAEPAAATAFALFALAIGLYSFRKNLGLGLVSVFLLTFIYYATWSVFNLLGAQGTLPP